MAKTALAARFGTFVASEYQEGREAEGYEKRPRFARVDTSQLWEEYQAQRELHKTLRQAKLAGLAVNRALQIDGVKAAARAKRSVIKITLNTFQPSGTSSRARTPSADIPVTLSPK